MQAHTARLPRTRRLAPLRGYAMATLAAVLAGCPTSDPAPVGSTSGPPSNPAEPTPPGSVCEQVQPEDGLDESGAGVAPAEIEEPSDALAIDWRASGASGRRFPSVLSFNTKNRSGKRIRLQFEITLIGEVEYKLPLPPRFTERTFAAGEGGVTDVDVQIAYFINAIRPGNPGDVVVSARLLDPIETDYQEVSRITVTGEVDEQGYVQRIKISER